METRQEPAREKTAPPRERQGEFTETEKLGDIGAHIRRLTMADRPSYYLHLVCLVRDGTAAYIPPEVIVQLGKRC